MGLGASLATRVPDVGGCTLVQGAMALTWSEGVVRLVRQGQAWDKLLVVNILRKGTELGREGVTELFDSLFHSTCVLIIETPIFMNKYWLAE